jgi:hypothetical protein
VLQGGKLRPIDDGSEFLQNSTVEAPERVDLGGFEEYVSLAREWIRAVRHDRSVVLLMPDGRVLRGTLHKDWSVEAARTLVGRTGDLSHAYKQIAVFPRHRKYAVVAVTNKDSLQVEFFLSWTLLFGQTAAVYAFNRVARALQRVCTVLGDLVMTNYYDDYPQLEAAELAESARSTLKGVFGLLGWELATEKKDLEFASSFLILGVQVDMQRAASGRVLIANKASRVQEVCSVLEGLIANACGTPSEVATIVARVHHMESVHFGRCAAAALRTLRRFGGRRKGRTPFADEELSALRWLATTLPVARPRTVQALASTRPVIIFTDGACEGEGASCGGVLLDGDCAEFFGLRVPEETYSAWRRGESTQVIGQAELWPVLLALLTWRERLSGRHIIFFIDQDAARQGLVKSYSPAEPSARIIGQVFVQVAAQEVYPWFARVPTSCNVADPASRLDFARVRQVVPGALVRNAVLPP